jgi:glycerophosphoryl diester phosphodiesterase
MALRFHFTDFPAVIAHRGLSAEAPENTLAAFRLAAKRGLSWIETDVRLSKDGVPMVFHDARLNRTTNGKGPFRHFTATELQQLDAGSWFAPEFSNQTIPTLDQVLDLALELNLGVNLEIKPNLKEEELTVEKIVQLYQERADNPPILFSSFSPVSLKACAQYLPHLPRAYIVDNLKQRTAEEVVRLTEALGCTSLHIHHSLLFSTLLKQCYYAPFDLMCFTVNDMALADTCWKAGIHSVFSDNGLTESSVNN